MNCPKKDDPFYRQVQWCNGSNSADSVHLCESFWYCDTFEWMEIAWTDWAVECLTVDVCDHPDFKTKLFKDEKKKIFRETRNSRGKLLR